MFPQEADWIKDTLAALPAEDLAVVLDVGSSNREFRSVTQPWIQRSIFEPLAARSASIVFSDVKPAPGIDIVADLMTAQGFGLLQSVRARIVLCCNVLEHVPDAPAFAARLGALVGNGGRLVVTVPHRYPHHNDPIDTMFRPDVAELVALFDGFDIERAEILDTGSYRQEFAKRPIVLPLRHLFRLPVPFLGWRQWKRSVSKLLYLVKPYQVTCTCLVKRASKAQAC